MWIFGHWVLCHDKCMLDPVLSLAPQGDPLSVPQFPCVLSPMGGHPCAAGDGQLPPGWFVVLPLPCRVPDLSLLEGWVYLGSGGARPPRLGSGMFCGACVPCVWCVMPWALSFQAGCPRFPSAGSLDPNCRFGVTLPWPNVLGVLPSWSPLLHP